jgi:HSF-type DNA-binding
LVDWLVAFSVNNTSMDYKYTYGSFLDFMSKMNSFTSSGPAASNHLEEAAIAADAGQNVSLGNSTMAAAAGIMAGVEEDMEEDDQKMPAIPSNDGGNDHNNDNNNHTDVSNFNGTEEEDDRKPAAREDHKTKASLKDPPPLAATATTTTSSSVASLKDPPPTNITNTKMSREGLAKFLQQGNYDLTRSHGVLGWHLYRLVEDAHQYGFTRFLHWCKDDENKDTLCIPKPQDFFRTILRNCQGHYGQFTSFQTTMNTYGFKYWKGDGGAAYYQHDFFQRGQPDDAKNNIVSRELKRREEMLLLQQQQQKQQQKQEQEDQQNEEVLPKEGGHNPDQDSTGRVERRRDINIKWEEPSKPKEPGSKRKTGETDVNLTRETVAKRSKLEHSPSRPKMHVDVNALANLLQHNDQDKSQKKKKSKSPLQRYTKEVYDDECCHCLDAGDLLCCDFCPQVQHWSCLTGRYQIEVKPSRDEDVFMCQDCMDVAIRHVAETQVVATSRRPYSRDMVISLPFQLQVEEDTYDLNVGPNFGSEIFRMLEDARLQGFEFIVAWRQDGHSFEIHHRPLFVEWLLKKTFSVGAYHTIGSRLRDHGFVRVYVIVDGIDDRGWTHPYLDIGRPYLANGICKMSQMSASAKAEYRAWKSEQDDYKKKQDADTAVQVSVSEIMAKVDAGGFQSLRRYQGAQHKDQCSICNDGGKLLLCDCCDNVNHLACLRHYFSVKNPGPEDDFLCYGCLQKSIDEDPSSPRSPTKNESEVNESSISANVNLPKDEAAEKYCLRDMKYGFGTAMYNLLEVCPL